MMHFTPYALVAAIALALVADLVWADVDDQSVPLDKLPTPVLESVKKQFPKAELISASTDTDNGQQEFEVKFQEGDANYDVSLTPQGAFRSIEKKFSVKSLPQAVTVTLKAQYPKATLTSAESNTRFQGDHKLPPTYEVYLVTSDKKVLEVDLNADGKILDIDAK